MTPNLIFTSKVFEKKNQKSAQTIAQLQKKIENYQKKVREIEQGTLPKSKPPKEILNAVVNKPKEFAHLIRNKFGSADNIPKVSRAEGWSMVMLEPRLSALDIINNTNVRRGRGQRGAGTEGAGGRGPPATATTAATVTATSAPRAATWAATCSTDTSSTARPRCRGTPAATAAPGTGARRGARPGTAATAT